MIVGTLARTGEVVRLEYVDQMWVCGGGSPKFIISKTPTELLILVADRTVEREAFRLAHRMYALYTPYYMDLLKD